MKTLEDIYALFERLDKNEKALNWALIEHLRDRTISDTLYLKYLDATQGDIDDLLAEAC